MRHLLRLLPMTACAALGWALPIEGAMAQAQGAAPTVALSGRMGSKALLVVNGGAPKALAAGEVHQGVKVLSVGADQTVIEVGGQKQALTLGGAPVSLGGKGGAKGARRSCCRPSPAGTS